MRRSFNNHIALLFALLILSATAVAQNISTQGKTFWLSFMTNGFRTNTNWGPEWVKTQVLISAKRDCTGTISSPRSGWREDFSVRAGNITTIEVPEEIAYHDDQHNESIQDKGLLIVTSDTTSVYCTNIANNSFDASYILPIQALADEYIIQCCEQSSTATGYSSYETSAMLIVAAEDNTSIDITPSRTTLGGHAANQEFSITLNRGQSYQLRSQRGQDLSGTHVIARDCKKIAVFNGNTLTCVPANMDNGYDHVFEQAMPLRSWGKNFVVTSSKDRVRDQVKITSSAGHNQVFKNGELLTTLAANQSYTFFITSDDMSCYLETTYPCAVYLYNDTSRDQNYDGEFGDPSMLWIAPIEQRINEITFATFDDEEAEIQKHYVNIIVKTEDTGLVYFDHQQVPAASFSSVHGNNEYSCTRMEINHSVHHLSCIHGFNAHVYGFGHAKGYAYMVGSNATDLTCNLVINDIEVQPNDVFSYCIEEPVTFSADINFAEYGLKWDFGDGTYSTDNPTTHTYSSKDIYHAKLLITIEGITCSGSDTDTTSFFVDVRQHYSTPVLEDICEGQGYYGHGFAIPHIANDTILGTIEGNPNFPNCQDSLLIYITAHKAYHPHFEEGQCWTGNAGVYTKHGFYTPYDQPGLYYDTLFLETVNGCDSIVSLTLDIGHQTHVIDTTVCRPFEWCGEVYPTSTTITKTFSTTSGCDSTVIIHLTVAPPIPGEPNIVHTCNTYEWNGHHYTHSCIDDMLYTSSSGCDSLVILDLRMNHTPTTWNDEVYAHDTIAPHWVITSTEFSINSYVFSVTDKNSECVWDSVAWSLSTSTGGHINWVLEPYSADDNGDSPERFCRLYVIGYTPDTVFIHATVYNECNPEGVVFSNWMVCSFYDTEETLAESPVLISPNPNGGEMDIQFAGATGLAEVRVYDMSGILVDQFTASGSRFHYTLQGHASGVYLFVINNGGRITTQKVSVF